MDNKYTTAVRAFNISPVAIGATAGVVGAGLVTAAVIRSHYKKSRKRKTRKSKNSRKRVHRGRKLKFGSKAYRRKYLNGPRRIRKQKMPYTARKRRDTSRRRIRYTKRNQPYIITSNGRARFISKRSASSSRKRSGGRY